MAKFNDVECSYLNRKNPNGLIITEDELTLPEDQVGLFLDGHDNDLTKLQGICDNFRIDGDVVYCDIEPTDQFLELIEFTAKSPMGPSVRISMIGEVHDGYIKDVSIRNCFIVWSDTDIYTKIISLNEEKL